MKILQLPGTDLKVSHISYGTTGFDGKFPVESGLELVKKYLEMGGNFIDTAHCYSFWVPGGSGASERFVGMAVREFGRESFVIATKGGHSAVPPDPRPDAFMSPEMIRKDLNESLERLGLPQVDVYYLHRDDPRVPVGEVMSALNERAASGEVRYLGASNWSVERYLAANLYAEENGLQPFVILQNQWSLAQPDWSDLESPGAMRYVLDSELATLEREVIPVAAYTATAGGYFATNGKTGGPDNERNRRRLEAANELAVNKGCSPNQIALAFLLNHSFPVVAVIGTRDLDHLEEAMRASEVELNAAELDALVAG
jgi:aryl-alcohol dehydrogenase-like predicted oxidoreductase